MLVGNTIKNMVSKNSTDLDGSTKLLKAISYEIERPLAHIFSLSLASSTFPEALKSTRVIPIHKAGDTTNCDNYRPISLAPGCCRAGQGFESRPGTPSRIHTEWRQ